MFTVFRSINYKNIHLIPVFLIEKINNFAIKKSKGKRIVREWSLLQIQIACRVNGDDTQGK